jgi:phosphoribosyl-AMP cyclohydrolase
MTELKKEKIEEIVNKVKFDEKGLVPAITQDAENMQVLMMAYMNKETLGLTLETRICHYWSRSKEVLWKKGGTSGHIQHVKWMKYDCDADTLLIGIDQVGAACHTGERSCFFRDLETE